MEQYLQNIYQGSIQFVRKAEDGYEFVYKTKRNRNVTFIIQLKKSDRRLSVYMRMNKNQRTKETLEVMHRVSKTIVELIREKSDYKLKNLLNTFQIRYAPRILSLAQEQ